MIRVSVIVPVLHEPQIQHFLDTIPKKDFLEIIVVDGADDTLPRITDSRVIKLESKPGRAVQMNVGAARARGEWLLFLHADCRLAAGALTAIVDLPKTVDYGCFRIRYLEQHWFYRLLEWHALWRSKVYRTLYGDQGIFVRRNVFEAVGGFTEIVFMEDVELSKRLKPYYCGVQEQTIMASAQYFERVGRWRTCWRITKIRMLYKLGVSADRLRKMY